MWTERKLLIYLRNYIYEATSSKLVMYHIDEKGVDIETFLTYLNTKTYFKAPFSWRIEKFLSTFCISFRPNEQVAFRRRHEISLILRNCIGKYLDVKEGQKWILTDLDNKSVSYISLNREGYEMTQWLPFFTACIKKYGIFWTFIVGIVGSSVVTGSFNKWWPIIWSQIKTTLSYRGIT